MKQITLLLFTVLLFSKGYSQNYECIKPSAIQYYTNADHYLRGIRIDSTKANGANTILYPYKTARGEYKPSNHLLIPKGSWLGEVVELWPDGQTYFYNYWGDTVIIQTLAKLNDTWTLYNDTSDKYYIATVTSVDTATILKKTDSVKVITITAYNSSGIDNNDTLNNKKIILSKNHGFAQTVDLYIFPRLGELQGGSGYDYFTHKAGDISFKLVDFYNPSRAQVLDRNVGDVLQYIVYDAAPPGYLERETMDKKYIGNNIQFITKEVTVTYPTVPPLKPTTVIKHDTSFLQLHQLIDLTFLPEEWNMSQQVNFNPIDTTFCIIDKKYTISDNYVFYNSDTTAIANTFEPCGYYKIFKINVGEINFSICRDPSSVGYERQLKYLYQNGIHCGSRTYLDINDIGNYNAIKIFPNPANNIVHIQNNFSSDYTATLVDVFGRTISSTSGKGELDIDVYNINNGYYILQISTEKDVLLRKKIVVRH